MSKDYYVTDIDGNPTEFVQSGPRPTDQTWQEKLRDNARDAEDAARYRKIKNSRSPFTVMYYGSRLLPDGRNRTKSCELLTGEMDAMIDSWPDEEHDV
jgi:hypothetical protein